MKKNNNTLFLVTILVTQFISGNSFSAIPTRPPNSKLEKKIVATSDAQSEIEKLTGQLQKKHIQSKFLNRADQVLALARQNRDQKNYILAIKRYNYIIKNFVNSKQAILSLNDKAMIYKNMGFELPATYNLNRAKLISTAANKNGSLKK